MDVMRGLAWGRIALGAAALAVPERFTRAAGVEPSSAVTYLARIYGARAIGMGTAYLTGSPAERARWHRIGLAIDVSDTVTGLVGASRRGAPLPAMIGFVLLTGGYAALGARDLRHAAQVSPG